MAGARSQLNRLAQALGQPLPDGKRLFPEPQAMLDSDLQMLKIPQLRRQTLQSLAAFVLAQPDADPTQWLPLKGIGPWTIGYARLRGLADSDVWLGGDLGIRKALDKAAAGATGPADPAALAPWRSYATLQLWHSGA